MRTRVRSPRPRLPGDHEPRSVWVEVEAGCLLRYGRRVHRSGDRLVVRPSEAERFERSGTVRRSPA
jgi:hypothetical protein